MNEVDAVQISIEINTAVAAFTREIDIAARKSENETRFKMTVLKELLELLIGYDGGFPYLIGWVPDQRPLADGEAVRQFMTVIGPNLRELPYKTQRNVIEIIVADLADKILPKVTDLHTAMLSAS